MTQLNIDDALITFSQLSSILVGEVVSERTAARHWHTVRNALPAGQLDQILQRFRSLRSADGDLGQQVKQQLIDDGTLGPVVKGLLRLWFTGVFQLGQGAPAPSGQDDYFEALMWSSVGAHPPALSDGYFGHWRYPPDSGT
jgi:hypothetical protein